MHGQSVRFLLLCEGTSDTALTEHLQKLLSHSGAAEVVGSAFALARVPDPGVGGDSVLARKVRTVLTADSEFDLLFVHRDADLAGYDRRWQDSNGYAVRIPCVIRSVGDRRRRGRPPMPSSRA